MHISLVHSHCSRIERIYYRRPYAIKTQRKARNAPQWAVSLWHQRAGVSGPVLCIFSFYIEMFVKLILSLIWPCLVFCRHHRPRRHWAESGWQWRDSGGQNTVRASPSTRTPSWSPSTPSWTPSTTSWTPSTTSWTPSTTPQTPLWGYRPLAIWF